jgi:hypothetical protein
MAANPAVMGPTSLSCAILRACGIDADTVSALTYEHVMGDLPTLKVTSVVIDPDTKEVDNVERTYELKRIS